jgi:precorrin-6B C5,15-methyltransferase / cobalt-precorrin-6B C5,C15-methyltransferase
MPDPWLTLVGLTEGGVESLAPEAMRALAAAEVVTGPPRHLSLLPGLAAEVQPWPVPFAEGLPRLVALRGRRVVMLVSGDPFWFGAGSVVARHLEPGEWRAIPAPSTFGLAAARMGWALEAALCLGLHAAPLARLRPHLAPGLRALVLLRDGAALGELARYLAAEGFGASRITVLEALGGPRERVRETGAAGFDLPDVAHPVAAAVEVAGDGATLPRAAGRPDQWFENDGQISKRPIRALALSALAPRAGEHLWDIGTGSGSIACEWLLAHPDCSATGFEADPVRAARARANAARLGLELPVVEARAPEGLEGPRPAAVFVGGGLSETLLVHLADTLPAGTRLVAHAVTLESEALLALWQARRGGSLLRVELAEAAPLGNRRGWVPARPIVQWSVVL